MTFARLVGVCALVAGIAAAVTTAALAHPAKAHARAVQHVSIVVKSDSEHGKKGPDGKWHDAFLPASFTVKAGEEVVVSVKNYDDGAHSFTVPGLKLNELILGGSESKPKVTTFTFTATKAGDYKWHCDTGCDPWAMAHSGFMSGEIKVTA